MSTSSSTALPARLRRTTIGCGLQGQDCLALAVSGRAGAWRVVWGMNGALGDREFAKRLSAKVWRRQFWTPTVDPDSEQESVLCGIDLAFRERGGKVRPVRAAERAAALRTQALGRFPHASEPTVVRGLEVRGPDGKPHFVGAVARLSVIEQDYRGWRKTMGILNPHIGSNAAALANTYLALCPEERRRSIPLRLLVLEGRSTTHAVLLDDWRLLDSLQYQMLENQRLDAALLGQWVSFFQDRHALPSPPVPCILAARADHHLADAYELWNPLSTPGAVAADEAVRALFLSHPDLAPLAFGMALQGA